MYLVDINNKANNYDKNYYTINVHMYPCFIDVFYYYK